MNTKNLLIDIGAIILIYFLPEISSLSGSPFYLFEPMRVIIIIAIVHTSKENAYILAVILPAVSYLFSNHPSIIKTFILSGDLLFNIFLYFSLKKLTFNKFLLMALCIIASKLAYYLAKYLLIQFSVLKGDLISTPLNIQILVVMILSGYVYLMAKFSKINQIH